MLLLIIPIVVDTVLFGFVNTRRDACSASMSVLESKNAQEVGGLTYWDLSNIASSSSDKNYLMLALANDGGYSITHNGVYDSVAHLFTKLIK